MVSTFSVVWQCGHSHPNRLSVSSPFSLCHVWPHSVQVISPFGVRRPICSMQFLYPHSICAGVSGGRCLLAATTFCWNFVLGFITKIDWALVCYLRFSWVWTWLSPTWRRLRSRPSVWRSAVPRLFLLGQFNGVIDHYLATDGFADVDVLLVVIVECHRVYFLVGKPVATALPYLVDDESAAIVNVLFGLAYRGAKSSSSRARASR